MKKRWGHTHKHTTTTTTTTPTWGRIIVADGIYSVGDKNKLGMNNSNKFGTTNNAEIEPPSQYIPVERGERKRTIEEEDGGDKYKEGGGR